MQSPMRVTTTQEPTTTATITATSYNHNPRIFQQILNPKTSTKKKKTQNLQQNPNLTDQSMAKLNQPSAARSKTRAVEDDEQRSAIATGRAKIGELSFRSSTTPLLDTI